MRRLALLVLVSAIGVAASGRVLADDYYNYGAFNPGIGYVTGIAGYVDHLGNVEGNPGGEYLFVTGGPSYGGDHYAYTYRVDTAGDPNLHPSNPQATGPISPRTFTQVGAPYYMGSYYAGHENAFYIDNSGIYYGGDDLGGITRWDFGWTNKTNVAPPTPITTQTLAFDEATGNWWAGGGGREMYMYDGVSWALQGTHKYLGGGHHDGMEIINGKLFVSDMTSDVLGMYDLDGSIDWANPDKEYSYSESAYVEGMGYGPNTHLWISGWSSGTFYEIGGGVLQQQFDIPEPGTIIIWSVLGALGFGWRRRRKA